MTDLSNLKILMLAPCLGKFGGIETFCLTLIEDLIKKGASVRLLRKKLPDFRTMDRSKKTKTKSVHRGQKKKANDLPANLFHPRDSVIKKGHTECDLVHLHNPMVEGVWHAKKFNKPCVMTIYNWRRKGIHPRLLAWRWAVSQADRRWYISEFVWDSWEKKRRHASEPPTCSLKNAPRRNSPPTKEKDFYLLAGGYRTKEFVFCWKHTPD